MGLFRKLLRDTSRDEEFLRLCARGTFEEVNQALSSWAYVGANFNAREKRVGDTLLMIAV